MAKENIESLVSILDKNCQALPDYDYMNAMSMLQQLYNEPMVKEIKYVAYGPTAQQLANDNERLKFNIQRLKRSHKNKRKQWRETQEQLQTQINELLSEIEYLEQFKNGDFNKKNTLNEYIKK
jgi:predicted nuclease with TOPRIM domain